MTIQTQGLPTDGPLTIPPMLQQLGERLLKGKTGSIVAINPENGEIILSEGLGRNVPFPTDHRWDDTIQTKTNGKNFLRSLFHWINV